MPVETSTSATQGTWEPGHTHTRKPHVNVDHCVTPPRLTAQPLTATASLHVHVKQCHREVCAHSSLSHAVQWRRHVTEGSREGCVQAWFGRGRTPANTLTADRDDNANFRRTGSMGVCSCTYITVRNRHSSGRAQEHDDGTGTADADTA